MKNIISAKSMEEIYVTYGDDTQTTIINQHGVTVYRMDEQGYMKRTA